MSFNKAAIDAIRYLIQAIGDDPDRPGLQETPARFLQAWQEDWGVGYRQDANELLKLFPIEDAKHYAKRIDPNGNVVPPYHQMVLVRDIAFYSTCEHHLAPFFGEAHVAYIPDHTRGIVGISKLARVVNHFARRLQVQERLTEQIAEFLYLLLSNDVAVSLSAAHMCMVSRGVMQPNARTVTTALRGVFYDDPAAHQEFIRKTER
jgi:GTP cyclohydrolase IA